MSNKIVISLDISKSQENIKRDLNTIINNLEKEKVPKIAIQIDEDSITKQINNVKKSVGSIGDTTKLKAFDIDKLEADGIKYYKKSKDIVDKVKKDILNSGAKGVDVKWLKDSENELKSFTAIVTKADNQIEEFRYKLADLTSQGTKSGQGFVLDTSTDIDKIFGSDLEKKLDVLNRYEIALEKVKNTAFLGSNKISDVSHVDSLNSEYAKIADAIDKIRNSGEALSREDKRNMATMFQSAKTLRDEYKSVETAMRSIGGTSAQTAFDSSQLNSMLRLEKYWNNNTRAAKMYREEYEKIKKSIEEATTDDDLSKADNALKKMELDIAKDGMQGKAFTDQIKGMFSKFTSWFSVSRVVMMAVGALKNMYQTVVQLDSSLVELQKVTDLSGKSLDKFTSKAFDVGKQIGRTAQDVIDATTIFKRAGYELNNSLKLAESALIMTNVGDGIDNVTKASSSLIAVLKGFNLKDTQAMSVVDAINEVSNTAAIDFVNITNGLERVSGTLSQTGASLAQTIGLLTGGFGSLRDIESVSSGLLMVSQRLRGIGEDGENIEGLAPKLQSAFKTIANIDIQDANGELRSTYEIIADMARVFPTLTSKQRQYLGEMAAGEIARYVQKCA